MELETFTAQPEFLLDGEGEVHLENDHQWEPIRLLRPTSLLWNNLFRCEEQGKQREGISQRCVSRGIVENTPYR